MRLPRLALPLVILCACGGGKSKEPPEEEPLAMTAGEEALGGVLSPGQLLHEEDIQRATVSAYVYLGSIHFVDDPAHAPAGTVPLVGGEVTIWDIRGRFVGSALTSGTGFFEIAGLPSGMLIAEVRIQPGSATADGSIGFTAFAGGDIRLGQSHPIGRDGAAALALDGVPPEALVAGTLQPLPAGTLVYPRYVDPRHSDLARVLPGAEWFFLVDREPFYRFSHDVEYVFVDAETGAVTRLAAEERPRVNYGRFWSDDLDLYAVDGVDWDQIEEMDADALQGLVAVPSPEVVQEPVAPPGLAAASAEARFLASGSDPESVFVLVVQASWGSAMTIDYLRMKGLFFSQGVPLENTRGVRLPKHRDSLPGFTPANQAVQEYQAEVAYLKQAIDARAAQGLRSTLILYWTGHRPTEGGIPSPTFNVEYNDDDRSVDWGAAKLGIQGIKACRVRVIIDTCYAELLGRALDAMFAALPDAQRPDLVIYCASRADQKAFGIPSWLPGSGGAFTNRILDNAFIENGDLGGLLDEAGNLRDEVDPFGQTPVVITRRGAPEWCASTGRIAFVSDRDGNDEIYSIRPDGTGLVRLSVNSGYDHDPVVSPDGLSVAWESLRSTGWEVYVAPLDGSAPAKNLTASPGGDLDPSWSPDGTRIAFTSTRDGGTHVFVMNADGTNPVRLSPLGVGDTYAQPSWSPSGARVAMMKTTGANALCTIAPDGTGFVRINANGTQVSTVRPAVWSPDGTRVAYVRDTGLYASQGDGSGGEVLLAVGPASGEVGEFGACLAWSPDGRYVAVQRAGATAALASVASGSVTPLAGYGIAWSPDGNSTVLMIIDQHFDLYLGDAGGNVVGPLVVNPGRDDAPSWSSR